MIQVLSEVRHARLLKGCIKNLSKVKLHNKVLIIYNTKNAYTVHLWMVAWLTNNQCYNISPWIATNFQILEHCRFVHIIILPDRSYHGHGKKAPCERSCLLTCNLKTTYPRNSHTFDNPLTILDLWNILKRREHCTPEINK